MSRLENRVSKLEGRSRNNRKSMALVIFSAGSTEADIERLTADAIEKAGLETDEVEDFLITINIIPSKPAPKEVIPMQEAPTPDADISDEETSGLVPQPWMKW